MEGQAPDFGSIDYGEIGLKVRDLRRRIKDLGLKELSEQLRAVGVHLSIPQLSRLERGKRRDVTLREIEAIAYVLKCPIRKLWIPWMGEKL